MSLAAFKRRIKPGQHVSVVNNLHPKLTGERTVHQVQSRGLKTMAEGATEPYETRWPAKDEWRIDGDTLHYVDPANPDKINFSYTFHFQEQPNPQTPTEEESEQSAPSLLASYRVTWKQKGNGTSRTETCIVDSDDMTRPGDPEQLHDLLRKTLALKHLPIGQIVPDNVVLQDAIPVCNCEPYPGVQCSFAQHKGERFYLTTSGAVAGCDVIHDRHTGRVVGIVAAGYSVRFLTMVRQEAGHQ
jgi:hypothetical protein